MACELILLIAIAIFFFGTLICPLILSGRISRKEEVDEAKRKYETAGAARVGTRGAE